MPFDLTSFEAEVALKLVPTDRLPAVAQDALEAGYGGSHVVRMAILESDDVWEIDRALGPMLAELRCRSISLEEAALRLARMRAERILESDEDPLSSLSYFYRLMLAGGHLGELHELGYLEDSLDIFGEDNLGERRRQARLALENLLDPELGAQRYALRQVRWEEERKKAEWPYILNSPTGRALFKERYKEKLIETRPFLWIGLVAWTFAGWGFSSWRTAIIGYFVSLPFLLILAVWGAYRGMKRERRDLLLRMRVPEEEI
jgi:hypothetical protein